MAVVSRISTVKLTAVADTRTVTATAVIQDTAAGLSVNITAAQVAVGAAPPDEPDLVDVEFYMEGDTTGPIINISFTTLQAQLPVTKTFYFTTNGLVGGVARAGTVGINLRIRRTGTPAGATDYDVDGYNIRSTKPAAYTISQQDKGWIRATTTAVDILSNVAAGGAKTLPFAYPNTVYIRKTLGHTPYKSSTITLALGSVLSSAIASATATFDATFAGAVTNAFPASSSNQTTGNTLGNSPLTGLAFTVFTTDTTDSALVDPRLTTNHLLLTNSNVFTTPPYSSTAVSSRLRLTSDLDFFTTNLRNAQGTWVGNVITGGQNGITITQSLADNGGLVTPIANTSVTSTQGGEAGWCAMKAWDSVLPGGGWTKTVTITAPATITGATYLLNSSIVYTLLAANPSNKAVVSASPPNANENDHWHPGDPLVIGLTVMSVSTKTTLVSDAASQFVSIFRTNTSTNKFEYLATDYTWLPLTSTVYDLFALTVSATDANLYQLTFTGAQTANWGYLDLYVLGVLTVGKVPIQDIRLVPVVDGKNRHSRYGFDPTGLFT